MNLLNNLNINTSTSNHYTSNTSINYYTTNNNNNHSNTSIDNNNDYKQNSNKQKIKVGLCVKKKRLLHKKYEKIFQMLNSQQIQTIELHPYLQQHWTKWPRVNVLIQFHRDHIPYIMIKQYISFYKPFLINNIDNQQLLWDRTVIHDILNQLNIPTPKHYRVYKNHNYINQLEQQHFGNIVNLNDQPISYQQYINNNINTQPHKLKLFIKNRRQNTSINHKQYLIQQQTMDYIILKSTTNQQQIIQLNKPFVQKPFDGHDHAVAIYYQKQVGGRRILSRKNHGQSSSPQSQYQPFQSNIRKDKNYIYEQFLPSNALQIKVYAIGSFLFAQSRRSPTLDVQKTETKAEQRYEVKLTVQQIKYCQLIIEYTGQYVCGIDIMRSNGVSYVIDINGWCLGNANFLKQDINKYWMICARLIRNRILQSFYPQKVQKLQFRSYCQYVKVYSSKQSVEFINKQLSNQTELNNNKKQRKLYTLIKIFSQDKVKLQSSQQVNDQQYNSRWYWIGQRVRQNRYEGYDVLSGFYRYQHDIRVRSQFRNSIGVVNYMKGYMNLSNNKQISPTITSMINKLNKDKQEYKQQNNKGESNELKQDSRYSAQFVYKQLKQILLKRRQQQYGKNINIVQLKSLFYFISFNRFYHVISELEQITKQLNINNQNNYIKFLQNIDNIQSIQYRLYDNKLINKLNNNKINNKLYNQINNKDNQQKQPLQQQDQQQQLQVQILLCYHYNFTNNHQLNQQLYKNIYHHSNTPIIHYQINHHYQFVTLTKLPLNSFINLLQSIYCINHQPNTK